MRVLKFLVLSFFTVCCSKKDNNVIHYIPAKNKMLNQNISTNFELNKNKLSFIIKNHLNKEIIFMIPDVTYIPSTQVKNNQSEPSDDIIKGKINNIAFDSIIVKSNIPERFNSEKNEFVRGWREVLKKHCTFGNFDIQKNLVYIKPKGEFIIDFYINPVKSDMDTYEILISPQDKYCNELNNFFKVYSLRNEFPIYNGDVYYPKNSYIEINK
ncbi:TPA: hypothetical protein ACG0AB_003504 [Elizabethkingia anophelis]|uniref:hypothetical protein n=1 Tax=Elizabethkingia TaxID=308865 RepID=UPI00162A5C4D|nr:MULTISPECIES: hypothetical protein [Elizabethkingia]MCT3674678.1 hypothetical protein [Elizabethkingia anophelis]MCT3682161.1 hypothetical protein [Elizabethkingia anophelis]MCT3704045.1 hypothetical protein [Elizabethkingia anophelis]MCT3771308.1 hypothetical protein [Elizabethkingia anophelis]MCT3781428.1 hypothetical protein [Elizabethkingia anophelis]